MCEPPPTDAPAHPRTHARLFLAYLAALPLVAACAARSILVFEIGERGLRVNGSVRLRVSNRVVALPVETYVQGVVAGEIGALLDSAAALQVQAIVARTYAVANLGRHRANGFDLCDTTHCLVYRPTNTLAAAARRAVAAATRSTAGRVLVNRGVPIRALFHADCGGATSAAHLVWGGQPQPYLRGVTDAIGTADPHARPWRFAVGRERLRTVLNADPKTAVGARLRRVRILERDRAGRALRVLLEGERSPVVRGEEIRGPIVRQFGARSVASTRFDVRIEAGVVVFEGRGRGHGVGLCQVGAMARTRAGASVESVLYHYFPGTTLASLHR